MNISVQNNEQKNNAEILIVGLTRHPENTKGWDGFAERFEGYQWTAYGSRVNGELYPSELPKVEGRGRSRWGVVRFGIDPALKGKVILKIDDTLHMHLFDGKKRMAIMCGKMRKRVFVNAHEIVLVSLREWQDSVCDIIDNYDENLVRKLKDKGLVPKSINIDVDTQYSSDDDDNMGFVFSTNIPDSSSDDEETLEKKKVDSDETTSEDDIDVDDI